MAMMLSGIIPVYVRAEDAPPPPPAPVPTEPATADTSGDDARAYAALGGFRRDPKLSSPAIAEIDARRNVIAERLAASLVRQGAEQEAEAHPVLAEKLYLQALGYRAAAGDALARLYADPAAIEAFSGEAEVRARLERLELRDTAQSLRWHLRRLPGATTAQDLDAFTVSLERLAALAGYADADVVVGVREAARISAGIVPPPDGTPRLDELAVRVLSAGDPLLAPLAYRAAAVRTKGRMPWMQAEESPWTLRVGVSKPYLATHFTAKATPSTTSATFAPASVSMSDSILGLGVRADVRWMRQPSPLGEKSGFAWGGMMSLSSSGYTLNLAMADPDTGLGTLHGRTMASRVRIDAIGVDAIAGWRWAIGNDSAWSLQANAMIGAQALRFAYGTRRGQVQGLPSRETEVLSTVAPDVGLEVEIAWRFLPRWSALATLGWQACWIPSIIARHDALFVDSTGSVSVAGTYEEGFSDTTISGPYLSLGVQGSF